MTTPSNDLRHTFPNTPRRPCPGFRLSALGFPGDVPGENYCIECNRPFSAHEPSERNLLSAFLDGLGNAPGNAARKKALATARLQRRFRKQGPPPTPEPRSAPPDAPG